MPSEHECMKGACLKMGHSQGFKTGNLTPKTSVDLVNPEMERDQQKLKLLLPPAMSQTENPWLRALELSQHDVGCFLWCNSSVQSQSTQFAWKSRGLSLGPPAQLARQCSKYSSEPQFVFQMVCITI